MREHGGTWSHKVYLLPTQQIHFENALDGEDNKYIANLAALSIAQGYVLRLFPSYGIHNLYLIGCLVTRLISLNQRSTYSPTQAC